MARNRSRHLLLVATVLLADLVLAQSVPEHPSETAQQKTIGFSVNPNGDYTIFDPISNKPILHSPVAVEIDHHWLRSSDYPQHSFNRETVADEFESGTKWTVSNTGLRGLPDLIYSLELHGGPDFVIITVTVRNRGSNPIIVQALRPVEALGPAIADLGGPDVSDRVLSDSFSEDRPALKIHDLADLAMHRGVGSQLLYNRQSKRNLFLGTLTSDKFLTILRLHVQQDHITSYEVDSAGTTELSKENSLEKSPVEDQIELSQPVPPGSELSSERRPVSLHPVRPAGGVGLLTISGSIRARL